MEGFVLCWMYSHAPRVERGSGDQEGSGDYVCVCVHAQSLSHV